MIEILFIFLFGLIIGSFLGMLSFRLPRELSILGRSFCDVCNRQISWSENIPILSYLLLKGKCRKCQKAISSRYPLIEFATALSFVLSYLFFEFNFSVNFISHIWEQLFGQFAFFVFAIVLSCIITLIITDLEHEILPDSILKVLSFPIFAFLLFSPTPMAFTHLFWGTISFTFFLFIYLITRERGMGFGDVKLAFLLGCLLGFPGSVVWFFLSFLSGSVIGLILIILRKAKFGRPLPFGPFLLISALVAFFFGDSIFVWYLNIFLP